LKNEIEIYEALNSKSFNMGNVSRSLTSNFRIIADVNKERREMLTKTEKQIVVGLFFGLAAKQIAITRNSSSRTVEGHIASIKQKLGVKKLTAFLLSEIFEECLREGFG
jgi:DNA-binding NarL/FixJ family response regulator